MAKVLLIKDIMSKKVITISEDTRLKEAAKMICHQGVSGVPIVDNDGKLVGIVSEKDLFEALYPSYGDLYQEEELASFLDPAKMEERLENSGSKKVSEIMTKKVLSTKPETPVVEVGAMMMAENVHRLPVLEKGKLVGLVSRRDIYQAVFKHLFNF